MCPGEQRAPPSAGGPPAAPPQPSLGQGALRLRPTALADCEFVREAESHPDAVRYVEQWSVQRHRHCIESRSGVHWIIEHRGAPVGYAILEGADDPDRSLLLRRIVIASRGRGHGRAAVLLLARYCFEVLGFHRLWLYVAVGNRRAYNLYRRLGFVEEGVARECSRHGDRYTSMHVMSLLDREFHDWLERHRRRPPAPGSSQP